MERFERQLVIAAAAYAVVVLLLMAFLLLAEQRECSADGYLLIGGLPAYDKGVPIRCARLPFPDERY